jgi:hypothetical protein
VGGVAEDAGDLPVDIAASRATRTRPAGALRSLECGDGTGVLPNEPNQPTGVDIHIHRGLGGNSPTRSRCLESL